MEHLALYRKWRPQTFDALVGQEDNAQILKSAVLTSMQGHAYLFCGTRGTGKTSTARILAKALNCQNPKDGEPCNECMNCKAITQGRSLDVIEIDAASNRGIDEIRDLLDKVHFVPAQSKYKVYIIDEVHMLTTESFNALLKTLEEPPSHIVFIMATTEARKVPMTILSRCQRYDFKPIGEGQIFGALKNIAQQETLNISDDALEFLAQKAKGSMRDALSLMDQGMGAAKEKLTVGDFGRILGSVMTDFWPQFLADIANHNVGAVFSRIEDLHEEGKDLRGFFQDFQQVLGDLLAYRGDMTQSYGRTLAAAKGLLHDDEIVDILTVLGESEGAFRYHRDTKGVCRFLMAKIMTNLQHKETVVAMAVPKAKKVAPPVEKAEMKAVEAPIPKAASPQKVAVEESTAEDDDEELWSQVLGLVRQSAPKTFAWLSKGNMAPVKSDVFTVSYYENDAMQQKRMELPEHKEALAKVLEDVFGRKMTVVIATDTNINL